MEKTWTENKNGVRQFVGEQPRYRAVCSFCGTAIIDNLDFIRIEMTAHTKRIHADRT